MLDRRNFMKFVTGGVVGSLATPIVWKSLDDLSIWSQNWGWIPRVEKNRTFSFVRTISKLSPDCCGISVRCVNGQPLRAMGDPKSPLSKGGLTPLAASEVQMLYSPARVTRPMRRTPDGGYVAISWSEAEKILDEKLRSAAKSRSLMCISGEETGTVNELLSALCTAAGCSSGFFMLPGNAQTAACAWKKLGGRGMVGYDIPNSDLVYAIGADIFESFGPVAANRRNWGSLRPSDGKPGQKLFYAGAVQNGTATASDMWVPIKPGTESAYLLGLLHEVLAKGKADGALSDEAMNALRGLVAEWPLDRAARESGATVAQMEASLKMLRQAKKPLVVVGTEDGLGGPVLPVMLGILLNVLMGRLNKDGGIRALPVMAPVVSGAMSYETMMEQNVLAMAEKIATGKERAPKLLLCYEANPLFVAPTEGMRQLFDKSEFKIGLTSFLDESAREADLILPMSMGLEHLDDVATPFGVGEALYALAKPVIKPLGQARDAGEVILGCAARMGRPMGFSSYEAVLQAKTMQRGLDWDHLLYEVCATTRRTLMVQLDVPAGAMAEAIRKLNISDKEGLAVAAVQKCAFGTPSSGLPPSATKLVDEAIARDALIARVNGATAKKFSLNPGALITVTCGDRRLRAKVALDEGVAMDTVALAIGFGHVGLDAFNEGKGDNVFTLLAAVEEPGTGFVHAAYPDVKIAKA